MSVRQQGELAWELGAQSQVSLLVLTGTMPTFGREPGRGAPLYSGDAVEFRQAYGFQLVAIYAGRSVVSTVRARLHARFEVSRVLLLAAPVWTAVSNARTDKENPCATRSICGAPCRSPLAPGLPRGRGGSGLNCESPPAGPMGACRVLEAFALRSTTRAKA